METHKAILLLQQEEDQARDPYTKIAQPCCCLGVHAHRAWSKCGCPTHWSTHWRSSVWLLVATILLLPIAGLTRLTRVWLSIRALLAVRVLLVIRVCWLGLRRGLLTIPGTV